MTGTGRFYCVDFIFNLSVAIPEKKRYLFAIIYKVVMRYVSTRSQKLSQLVCLVMSMCPIPNASIVIKNTYIFLLLHPLHFVITFTVSPNLEILRDFESREQSVIAPIT